MLASFTSRYTDARRLGPDSWMISMLNYRLVHTPAPTASYALQYLLLDRERGAVFIIGTLYAAHLARSGRSRNTIHGELLGLPKLLTWKDENEEAITTSLSEGAPPTSAQAYSLNHWLRCKGGIGFEGAPPTQARTLNASMSSTYRCIRWALVMGNAHRPEEMRSALHSLDVVWSQVGRIAVGE